MKILIVSENKIDKNQINELENIGFTEFMYYKVKKNEIYETGYDILKKVSDIIDFLIDNNCDAVLFYDFTVLYIYALSLLPYKKRLFISTKDEYNKHVTFIEIEKVCY